MRKILAIGLILVMVVIGFTAMLNPVASDDCGDVTIEKWGTPTCRFGGAAPGEPPKGWNNENVPLNTFVTWELKITVTNTHNYAIQDVTVKDRLGGELELMDADKSDPDIDEISISQGTWSYSLHGKTNKVFLEWDLVDDLAPAGDPGDSATFIIGIGTDLNPAGKQEYTSTGCYWLNSGATVKWIDPDGHQDSATSNRIMVTVIGEEEE